MTPQEAQKTVLNTDYPVDKVGFRYQSSITVPQASSMADSVLVTIPHGLPYTPLCIGSFSEFSDFSVYYEIGNPPQFYFALFNSWGDRISVTYESDATNIYVYLINFDTTRTIYYRISGLVPSNATSTPKLTSLSQKSLIFNTDNNYMKIFYNQRTTYSVGMSGLLTATIPHELGYRPTALVFTEDEDGRVRLSGSENSVGITGMASTSYVTTTSLIVDLDTVFTNVALHCRIYLDD